MNFEFGRISHLTMMTSPLSKSMLYLYNGRIRPIPAQLSVVVPHLLAVHGRVLHADDGEAPLGLDFRSPDFSRVRQSHQQTVEFVDLKGATVLPGLCDAHVHFLWWSDTLDEIDLTRSRSLDDALTAIRETTETRSQVGVHQGWVTGHGWSHNGWESGTLPTAQQLDSVTGPEPALLSSKCGHLAWVNSAALKIARIQEASDPEGGSIHRDPDGTPTGILAENAIRLVGDLIPPRTRDQQRQAFLKGQAIAHSLGITTMHTPESMDHFEQYQDYRLRGELKTRIHFLMPAAQLPAMADLRVTRSLGDDLLQVSGTKLFADGSLGGRTAAMYEPYLNSAGEKHPLGITVADEEEILRTCKASQALDIPMVIHAIGDRAVGDVLRAYLECHEERQSNGRERLAHRVEHLQVIHPRDLGLLERVKPVASVQPIHLCADIDPILEHWGPERGKLAYAFHTISEAGCPLIFGSDAPVEPISPWLGIFAALTRQDLHGRHPGGFHRNQCLSLSQSLEAYTAAPARVVGAWPRTGNLLPGAHADFSIYPTDPLLESPDSLRLTRATRTYLGAQVVWAA